ncbi:MAG: hypothetical protein AAGK04_02525 [Planctomycetota bacterium]
MKVMLIAFALLGALVAVGVIVDQTAAPALPKATHITPPAGVERLAPEFTPTMILRESGFTPTAGAPNAGGAGGGGAGVFTNQWIPYKGFEGGIRGIKRRGNITRVSIEWSDPTIPGEFYIIAEIPGDPGDIEVGGLAKFDGQIKAIEYDAPVPRAKPVPTYRLVLWNASITSYRKAR